MAGLCGCWKLSSQGHCDGCGYKVLLRGALNNAPYQPSSSKSSRHDKSSTEASASSNRPSSSDWRSSGGRQTVTSSLDRKTPTAPRTTTSSSSNTTTATIQQLPGSPYQYRRHSHPFQLHEDHLSRSKHHYHHHQHHHHHHHHPQSQLPQSSAYNVPLPQSLCTPECDSSNGFEGGGGGGGVGGVGGGSVLWRRRAGGSFPQQMLLSVMQPPRHLLLDPTAGLHLTGEEGKHPTSSCASPTTTAASSSVSQHVDTSSLPPCLPLPNSSLSTPPPPPPLLHPPCPPSPRVPPFEIGSFLPPVSPRWMSDTVGPPPSSVAPWSSMASSSSLQVRYQALSLARASSRSHSDLRQVVAPSDTSSSSCLASATVSTSTPDPSSTSPLSGSRPSSMYSSHTLPAPPPPTRARRLSVRRPQESNRSQPAFGLKQTNKTRPTIFGTLADGGKGAARDHKVGLPQGARTRSSHEHETSDGEHQSAPDHEHALVYEDGVLVAGSLQALVQHAVPTGTYYPDTAYLFAFLLSARLFIKPHELLQRICAVGFAQQGITNSHDASSVKNEQLSNFVRHMVQLLAEWSETFPYDFRDDRLMAGVRSLTHRCIALRPDLRRDVTQVLHNLLNKLTHLERFEESAAKLAAPPPADLIPQPSDISEICASPLVMAQQLTHIELERLSFIGPEEFVQAFAKDNLDTSYKDLKRTCNLEAYIQWFNRLSYLVATHACSHVKRKVRVRLIEWWVEVARECFNIGNFNSLMGVIAGLNMAPVSRMKKTWSKVQSAKFSVLEHQMDPSSNFSSYRSTLKAAMWRSAGALDDRQKIVIPFFSLLVKDLYFLNEGCANRLPNGHINFDKFWQLAKQVTEFLAWKQVSCPFTRHPEVITYLLTTQILSETGLALASFECESPENHYEKERYKALKSALNPTT
ncbi:uncharacterized protein LOC143035072 isoform X2 [Oratosquilla oratoria]|uniref:uncharacterized protein LOC143035072 isoform X2 n=1 Tax=Oratosquilla oratoria TaxID=337810 RepID=UPI003F75BDCF